VCVCRCVGVCVTPCSDSLSMDSATTPTSSAGPTSPLWLQAVITKLAAYTVGFRPTAVRCLYSLRVQTVCVNQVKMCSKLATCTVGATPNAVATENDVQPEGGSYIRVCVLAY